MLESFTHEVGDRFERVETFLNAWFRVGFIERMMNQPDGYFLDTDAAEQALKDKVDRSVARFMDDRTRRHLENRVTDEAALLKDQLFEVERGYRQLDISQQELVE